tara:strand:- start:8301 stop:8912 length:612 start_codon:yes stop_codon:yes gene_type:complete
MIGKNSLEKVIIIKKNEILGNALVIMPIALLFILIIYILLLYITNSLASLNVLLLISSVIAFAGLWLTSFSLLTNSLETRRKVSIDILFDLEKNERFFKSKDIVMKNTDLQMDNFLDSQSYIGGERRRLEDIQESFKHCTNIYEFLALSIRNGIIDEDIFMSLHKARFLKFWRKVEPIITTIQQREFNKKIYENIEWLAKRCK